MIELLRQLDIFDGVDDETLQEFASKGSEEHLAVGEPVWVEGKSIERFMVLAEGTVEWSRTINGVDIVVGERGAPTYAGATNLLTGDPDCGQRPRAHAASADRVGRRHLPSVSA